MNKFFKLSLFMILFFCLTTKAMAWDVSLDWEPNIEPDLAGYNVYRRSDPNSPYILVETLGITSAYTVKELPDDVYQELVVTAFDTVNLESDYSNKVWLIWIRSITSPNNGLYSIGSQLDISLNFSEPVSTQGEGGIAVTFNTGKVIHSPSFTNVQNLVLCYTVEEGENTDKLDITDITLDPNTTLASVDGLQPVCNLVTCSNLAANSNIRIDTEKPVPPRSLRISCP